MNVQKLIEKRAATKPAVSPGLPFSLTDAHSVGDEVWQGDLGIQIVDGVPGGYVRIAEPKDQDRQLVPLDGSPGSHHRIQSWDGVELYRPFGWGESDTDLRGPCVVFTRPNAIVHEPGHSSPHGTVNVESPMTVLCRYQRNLNHELREERRARD